MCPESNGGFQGMASDYYEQCTKQSINNNFAFIISDNNLQHIFNVEPTTFLEYK